MVFLKYWFYQDKILIFVVLIFLSCTIKMSPHAQNEIYSPCTNETYKGEAGGGFAINQWVHQQDTHTIYIPSYPGISASIFYKQFQKQGIFSGFGGVEGIVPFAWNEFLEGGFLFWLKIHLGGQFEFPFFTLRLNFLPNFWLAMMEGQLNAGIGISPFDLYQFTGLLHNPPKSNPTLWLGVRNSNSALGLVVGSEYSYDRDNCLRFEYSYLRRTPYSLMLSEDDLNGIEGSVHYFTFGVFRRF